MILLYGVSFILSIPCVCACDSYSRNVNERCISPVEEGAIEDLKNKGEVLQREERNGGAHGEQQALQGGEEQRERGGAQVRLPLSLSCR